MTTIETLPTKTATSIMQTMKDATNEVIALSVQRQQEGINEYIETRIEQLGRFISEYQQESQRAKGEDFARLQSYIGDLSGRKWELMTMQSNLRLGNYKPKETRK